MNFIAIIDKIKRKFNVNVPYSIRLQYYIKILKKLHKFDIIPKIKND